MQDDTETILTVVKKEFPIQEDYIESYKKMTPASRRLVDSKSESIVSIAKSFFAKYIINAYVENFVKLEIKDIYC